MAVIIGQYDVEIQACIHCKYHPRSGIIISKYQQ